MPRVTLEEARQQMEEHRQQVKEMNMDVAHKHEGRSAAGLAQMGGSLISLSFIVSFALY
jgi:hypothetical protein